MDCIALKKNVFLTREDAFSDMLPKTGNANYFETKHCDSRIQCAAVCVFCAGFLYNRMTGTCHLLKARLSEKFFDRSRKDTGWELYIHLNGWSLSWGKNRSTIYIIDKQNNDFFKLKFTSIKFTVCESGWQLYNAHCYINIQKKVTWTEAKVFFLMCKLYFF